MIDFKKIKKGDKVTIQDSDQQIIEYLLSSVFKKIDIQALRHYCLLKDGQKYTVQSNCYSCKMLYILVGKNNLQVKYKFLS